MEGHSEGRQSTIANAVQEQQPVFTDTLLRPNGNGTPANSVATLQEPQSLQQQVHKIPSTPHSKLYARSQETARLLHAYTHNHRCHRLVIITGPSGTGKTELALTLQQQVAHQKTYFGMGKFDQLRAEPYGPFKTAIEDCVRQMTAEGLEESIRQQVRVVGSAEIKVLTTLIPSLTNLLGTQPALVPPQKPVAETPQRSLEALCTFLKTLHTIQRVVWILDDLQWADPLSLELLERLTKEDSSVPAMFFLGTCRDNVSPTGRLSSTLSTLENDNQVGITRIPLTNLEADVVQDMIADQFHLSQEDTNDLSNVVFGRTHGNPYFIVEFLRMLQENRVLVFDAHDMEWELDTNSLKADTCGRFETIQDLLETKLQQLPSPMVELLKAASCLGVSPDPALLRWISPVQFTDLLKQAVQKGLLFYKQGSDGFSFVHDGVQAAAYSLIPADERECFHLAIGRRLWRALDAKEMDKYLFVVLEQVFKGSHLVGNPKERYAIAALCLKAVEKSARWSFAIASKHLDCAFSMLGEDHWREEYDLSLSLYNAAAEVEFCMARFDRMEDYLQSVFRNARCFSDTIRARSTEVYVLGTHDRMDLAIVKGLEILSLLGEHLPEKRLAFHTAVGMWKIKRMLRGKSNEFLKRLPLMVHEDKIASMQILNLMFMSTGFSRPDLHALVVLKMMELTLKDGLSAISAVAFVGYGLLLSFTGHRKEGGRFGRLALELLDMFDARAFRSRCYAFQWGMIHHWTRPMPEALGPLYQGYQLGLETGDLEFAMLNATLYCFLYADCGQGHLEILERQATEIRKLMVVHKTESQLQLLEPFLELIRVLLEPSGDTVKSYFEETPTLRSAIANNNGPVVSTWYLCRCILAFHLEEIPIAAAMGDLIQQWMDHSSGSCDSSPFVFFHGLAHYGMARRDKKRSNLAIGLKSQRRLERRSVDAPFNNLNKSRLLAAERVSILGKKSQALNLYTEAIECAKEKEYLEELALGNRLAARHFEEIGDMEQARRFLRQSIEAYQKWGALAVARHLETELGKIETTRR